MFYLKAFLAFCLFTLCFNVGIKCNICSILLGGSKSAEQVNREETSIETALILKVPVQVFSKTNMSTESL